MNIVFVTKKTIRSIIWSCVAPCLTYLGSYFPKYFLLYSCGIVPDTKHMVDVSEDLLLSAGIFTLREEKSNVVFRIQKWQWEYSINPIIFIEFTYAARCLSFFWILNDCFLGVFLYSDAKDRIQDKRVPLDAYGYTINRCFFLSYIQNILVLNKN